MAGLVEHSHRLQSAEYFLDPFALALAGSVPGLPRGATIDSAAAAAFVVLCDMRRISIRGRLVCVIGACLSLKVYSRITRIVQASINVPSTLPASPIAPDSW